MLLGTKPNSIARNELIPHNSLDRADIKAVTINRCISFIRYNLLYRILCYLSMHNIDTHAGMFISL